MGRGGAQSSRDAYSSFKWGEGAQAEAERVGDNACLRVWGQQGFACLKIWNHRSFPVSDYGNESLAQLYIR